MSDKKNKSLLKTEMLAESIYNLVMDCLKNSTNFYEYIDSVDKYNNLGTIVITSNAPNSYFRITDDQVDITLNYSIEFGGNVYREGVIPELDINVDYLKQLLEEKNITSEFKTKPFRTLETQGITRLYKITYQKNKKLQLK